MLVQGDGKGGWVVRMAEIQFHHYTPPGRRPHPVQGQGIWAFGVVEMDNGEVGPAGQLGHRQKPIPRD